MEPESKAERIALLTELRAAKEIEVRYLNEPKPHVKRFFRRSDSESNAGTALLQAIEADFLKRPNGSQSRCGFHADVAILSKMMRTLKTELCFGCREIRVQDLDAKEPRYVYWSMVKADELKVAVRLLFPGVPLGRER